MDHDEPFSLNPDVEPVPQGLIAGPPLEAEKPQNLVVEEPPELSEEPEPFQPIQCI